MGEVESCCDFLESNICCGTYSNCEWLDILESNIFYGTYSNYKFLGWVIDSFICYDILESYIEWGTYSNYYDIYDCYCYYWF